MAIASRFRHELVISRRQNGETNDRGDATVTFQAQSPIAGLIQEHAGTEIRGSEPALTGRTEAWLYVPIGTEVAIRDRVTHGDRVYELVSEPRDAAGRGRHLEADLLLVTP